MYIYIFIYYRICVFSVISKRRPSLGQTLIKIKHEVKWMLKFVRT